MAKTKIQYVTYSWSGWRGCTHASVGCEHCFSETMSKRNPTVLGQWGPDGTRVVAALQYWRQPLNWNRAAACDCGADEPGHSGHLVGCPQNDRPRVLWDLSDPFESWDGTESDGVTPRFMVDHMGNRLCTRVGTEREVQWPNEAGWRPLCMADVRDDAFRLAGLCQNLDFLWVTKRPQNIRPMWPEYLERFAGLPVKRTFRDNIWLGCSCSTQHDLDQMVPHLLDCRDLSPVLWLSLEPLLAPINLHNALHPPFPQVDWVVVGGESGPNARPCNVQWIRDIVRQCREADVAVYVKQLGSRPVWTDCFRGAPGSVRLDTYDMPGGEPDDIDRPILLSDRKGGDMTEWAEDLRVREFPSTTEDHIHDTTLAT